MRKITFEDYKKAIRAKFEIEKDGVYFNFLNPPSQANLRNLCWERFKSNNNNQDDLSIFSSFFEFEFDSQKKNHFKDQTDRFRPIGSFLKNEKDPANRYAVELAAILVDFQPRPFKKYKERGLIIPENPIDGPKIPFAFGLKENDEDEIEDENDGKKDSETINPSLKKIIRKWALFFEKLLKRSKRTIISVAIIFSLTGTIIYFAFFKKDYMQWSQNHYEVVDKEGIEGNPNEIIQYEAYLLDFKKIPVCDTTTWFTNGKSIIWYAKTHSEVDFFTTCGNGRHPESSTTIRPVTYYIFNKYKKPCALK